MSSQPHKVLIIRNDKIGDFMLSWPSFALLKSQYPDAEITALVPAYTAPLAEHCQWIDKVLIDEKKKSFFKDISSLSKKIKNQHYDLSISLFSEARTAIALKLAGVKNRIGPATKIAQIFLNKTLRQKRSQSKKPEYEYNLDLIKFFIHTEGSSPLETPLAPYLSFAKEELNNLKDKLRQEHAISEMTKIIIIHPGSGGSAINLSLEQYAELANTIAGSSDAYFVITAGPGESAIAKMLSDQMKKCRHHIHSSTGGIIDFSKFIGTCDLFISGSTGPLHIAGALNVNTAAFYPARKSATSLRWQTLNTADKRLAFSPVIYTGNNDMQQIDINAAANKIIHRFIA